MGRWCFPGTSAGEGREELLLADLCTVGIWVWGRWWWRGGRFKHRMLAVLPPSPCWAWSVGMTSLGRNCNSCYPASALCLWQAGRSTARDPGTHSNRLSSALARTARLTPVTVWSQWHWLQEVRAVGWDWLGFIPSRSLQSLTEDKAVILAAHMLIAKNLLLLACSKTF